jgi:transcriptional regulator with GAF, ATPase, and Fis domain
MTTRGCHADGMGKNVDVASHQEAFDHLKAVRAELLEHYKIVRQLAAERRQLIQALVDKGFSQADVGRELGVTRQAIQKMLAC